MGPFNEFRDCTIKPGTMPDLLQIWADNVHIRTAFSPLIAALYSDVGPLNRFIHIWPYAKASRIAKRSENKP